jgi:hypothetical protein
MTSSGEKTSRSICGGSRSRSSLLELHPTPPFVTYL